MNRMNILDYTLSELQTIMKDLFQKGNFHAKELYKHLYSSANLDLSQNSAFIPVPDLISQINQQFYFSLKFPEKLVEEEGTIKFITRLDDDNLIESVVIPMENHYTLCLSSQIGCRFGCRFCQTGKMGFIRNLSCDEIISQYMTARFVLKKKIKRIVYMGMGEPLDNWDSVSKSIDIFSELKGLAFPLKYITVSTAGYIPGMKKFLSFINSRTDKPFHKLILALSVHSAIESVRTQLMPVNKKYSLKELKKILNEFPQTKVKDQFYCEYMLIPGENDSIEQWDALAGFLEGLIVKVNIIPYNPSLKNDFNIPDESELEEAAESLNARNIKSFVRKSKGSRIRAACGQLGQIL